MAAAFLPLAGDGVITNLFHYLWQKDELDCRVEGVSIPDTIVYRHRQANNWYFTASDGAIKRKHKANVTNAKIEVCF
jgi:hypothetical protein